MVTLCTSFPFSVRAFFLSGFGLCSAFVLSAHSVAWGGVRLVSHRGARADNHENTLFAFDKSLKDGAAVLEMDTQVTKDGVVVLYHPVDLSVMTDCFGPVASKTYDELLLCKFNRPAPVGGNPKLHTIPALKDVLPRYKDATLMFDLKVATVAGLIDPIAKLVKKAGAWDRVLFYSTEPAHIAYLHSNYPKARFFQDRDSTRKILVRLKMLGICEGPLDENYVAFELRKDKLFVVERLTLGSYETEVNNVPLLDKDAVNCMKFLNKDVKIFLFGINTRADYELATKMGVDGVVMDSMKIAKPLVSGEHSFVSGSKSKAVVKGGRSSGSVVGNMSKAVVGGKRAGSAGAAGKQHSSSAGTGKPAKQKARTKPLGKGAIGKPGKKPPVVSRRAGV